MRIASLRRVFLVALLLTSAACSDNDSAPAQATPNANNESDTATVSAQNLKAYFEKLVGNWELVEGNTKEFDANGTPTNSSTDTQYMVRVTKSSENVYKFSERFCTQTICGDAEGSFRIDGNVITILVGNNNTLQPTIEKATATSLTYTYLYQQVHLKEAEEINSRGEWIRRSEYRRMNGARGESYLRLKRTP